MASKPPDTTAPSTDALNLAQVPRLGLRPREAPQAPGIGERKLWEMTAAGKIPHAKVGSATVYPVDMLEDWLRRRAEEGGDDAR